MQIIILILIFCHDQCVPSLSTAQASAKALLNAKNKPKKEKAAKAKAKAAAADKWVILRAELFGPAFVLLSKNPEIDWGVTTSCA